MKSKKVVQNNVQAARDYFHQYMSLWQTYGKEFAEGYRIGERMNNEAGLLLSGQPISETELPLWVQKIYQNLLGIYQDQSSPRENGKRAGQLFALGLSIRDDYLEALAKGTISREGSIYLEGGRWLFDFATSAHHRALHDRQKEAAAFFAGFAEGQRRNFDRSGQMLSSDAFPINLLLVLYWREIVKLKTIPELYSFLDQKQLLKFNRLGTIERLQQLCKRLGLKLAPRGRPRK